MINTTGMTPLEIAATRKDCITMVEGQYYCPVENYVSRRRFRRELTRKFGRWHSVKLKYEVTEATRKEAFEWCSSLDKHWGCDSTKRRFYFANSGAGLKFVNKFNAFIVRPKVMA